MKRYKRGKTFEPHSLEIVYQAYGAKRETQFVEIFFQEEEINGLVEACGLSPVQPGADMHYEEPVMIGTVAKRADLVIKEEDVIYYFEVMSQSYDGRWDNDHHEQFLLKTMKLGLTYGEDNVHSFAIAFKEFDAHFLEDIQRMENGYAVHLRFDDTGWYPDVYGIEEKEKKRKIKNVAIEERGSKWLQLAAEKMEFKNRKDSPERGRYLYVGKAYKGVRMGIEWVMNTREKELGIKINGSIVAQEGLTRIVDNTDEVIAAIQEKVPGFKFLKKTNGAADRTIMFEFDTNDYSAKNIQLLKDITLVFAEECGVPELLQ